MVNGEWGQQVGRNGARNLSTRRCRSERSAAAGFLHAPSVLPDISPTWGGDWPSSGAGRSSTIGKTGTEADLPRRREGRASHLMFQRAARREQPALQASFGISRRMERHAPDAWLPARAGNDRTRSGRDTLMGLFSKDIKTMDDLFVHTLRDIYYAEQQILKALPKMIGKATNPMLKQGFEQHLRETEGHVQRVEQVFEMHGVEAKGVNCPAIDGIIEEANEIAGEVEDRQVLDAALIAAAQAVEHYEMTRYGTLIAWAKELGRPDCASVLEQ